MIIPSDHNEINEDELLDENATFLDKLNRGDSHFNIFSGSKNYVVDKISSTTYQVVGGKGWDKGSDAYLNKIYKNKDKHLVDKSALVSFIKMINRKMGYRESIDTSSDELNEELYNYSASSLQVGDEFDCEDYPGIFTVTKITKHGSYFTVECTDLKGRSTEFNFDFHDKVYKHN